MSELSAKTIEHPTSKEWVVMIHGIGGSSAIWFKQIKEYRKHFNLLLVDLPGHGSTKAGLYGDEKASMINVAKKVLSTLDKKQIYFAHFAGISMGTIIVQCIHDLAPDRVSSMILGGAVEWIYNPLPFVMRCIEGIKHFIPYMWAYQIVAWIMMPKKRHKEARTAFVREAVRLGQKEFFAWYKLLYRDINSFFDNRRIIVDTPTIYLMGSEDYMFLPVVKKHCKMLKSATLHIIEKCGHVCNIEQEREFNRISVDFIQRLIHSNADWKIEKVVPNI